MREADDLWTLSESFSLPRAKIHGCPTANFSARGQPPPPQTRRVSFQVKNDSPVNEHRDLATDPRERLKDMDRDGIERGMLFPSAGLYLTSVEEEAYAAALAALTIVAVRLLQRGSKTAHGRGCDSGSRCSSGIQEAPGDFSLRIKAIRATEPGEGQNHR